VLVADAGREPRIAAYSGRGALGKWLQVVTLNAVINLRNQRRPVEEGVSERSLPLVSMGDPELGFIKERYRDQFLEAFREAIAGLPSEPRNLLRLHFVDGATLDQMAATFHLHRATIARRIADARGAILESARRRLADRLNVAGPDLDSLLRLMRSQLDLSLSTLLAPSV
jgi:RNA polymerase sigma-70 factor (ECF subfamily)